MAGWSIRSSTGAALRRQRVPADSDGLPPSRDNEEPYSIRLALHDAAADGKARCLISFLAPLEKHGADMIDAAAESAREAGQFPVAVICELRPDLATGRDYPIDFLPTRRHVSTLDRLVLRALCAPAAGTSCF